MNNPLKTNKVEFMIETITYIALILCAIISPYIFSFLHPFEYQQLSLIEMLDLRFLMLIVLLFSYLCLALLSAWLLTMMIIDYIKSVFNKKTFA